MTAAVKTLILKKEVRGVNRAVKQKALDVVRLPMSTIIQPTAFDEYIEKHKQDFKLALTSARSFFEMKVDPTSIKRCVNRLITILENEDFLSGISTIIACSTLDPKEWQNPVLVEYLLATLALKAKASTLNGDRVRAGRIFIVPDVLEEYDNEILSFLETVHEAHGFIYKRVPVVHGHEMEFNTEDLQEQIKELQPIFNYQLAVGAAKLDPAFLFVESDHNKIFYRIEFQQGGGYPKVWITDNLNENGEGTGPYISAIKEIEEVIFQ